MAVKIDCPRCKMPLAVPGKKTGSYVNCPHCNGRFWVPRNTPADSSPAAAMAPASGVGGKLAKPPPQPPPQPPTQPPAQAPPQPPPPAESGPVWLAPPQPPPAPRPKVARFISAEAAQSPLKPSEDGQLPQLHLLEGDKKEKPQSKSTTVNPLVLFGVISISVVLCILLVLSDTGTQSGAVSTRKANARLMIEEQFFGEIGSRQPLALYQVYLREAQREYTRGDRKAERRLYRKVLDLLRAERGKHDKGLTGSRSRDKQLEEYIAILLSDR